MRTCIRAQIGIALAAGLVVPMMAHGQAEKPAVVPSATASQALTPLDPFQQVQALIADEKMKAADWLPQATAAAPQFTPSQKQQLQAALDHSLLQVPQRVGELTLSELWDFGLLEKTLWSSSDALQVAVTEWVVGNPAWKKLDPLVNARDLNWLLQTLDASQIAASRTAENQVVDWLLAKLKDEDYLTLSNTCQVYDTVFNSSQRQALGGDLIQKLTAVQAKSGPVKLTELSQVLNALIAQKQGEPAAALLFERQKKEPGVLGQEGYLLLGDAQHVLAVPGLGRATHHELLSLCLPLMLTRLAAHDPKALALEVVVRWLVDDREFAQANKVTKDLYRQLLVSNQDYSKVSLPDIFWLSVCLMRCDEIHEGKLYEGYPGYGKALATHLMEVPFWERQQGEYLCFVVLASPLATPEDQAAIEAKEESPLMEERVAALKLTGTVRKLQGRLTQWQKELDKRLTNTQLSGDRQAELLVARAYATEIEVWDRAALSGRQYLDRALAKAQSEPEKRVCIRSMVYRACKANEMDEAASFLESVAGQLKEEESLRDVADLRHYIAVHRTIHDRMDALYQNARAHRRLEGQIELLEQQLALSRKRKRSPEAVASLEQQIQETRAQLTALK